jgi:tetratricopeptide (TPR) repeat protein
MTALLRIASRRRSVTLTAAFAALVVFLPSTIRAAEPTAAGRSVDSFVMAAYGRTLDLLDDQSKQQAEGIVQRDYARMRRRQIDLAQLEQDAQEAMKLHAEYPGAHFLLGYVRYEEGKGARTGRDYRSEEAKMRAAHAAYTKAIGLLRTQDDPFRELPVYYLYRINAAVALAYAVPQVEGRAKLLEEAVQDARESLTLEPRYATCAYAAMGNALEKLAWMVEGNADKFDQAVQALTTARDKSPRTVRYRIALGRCKYKAVEATVYRPGEKSAQYLEEAEAELKEVLDGDGQNFDRKLSGEERAEVHYWLGRAAFLQGRYAAAEEAFQAVLAAAAPNSGWRPLALESSADGALRRAERAKDPASPEIQTQLRTARQRAAQLAAANPSEAARIRGQAFLIERDPVQALAALEKALPPNGRAPATLSEIRLGLVRHALLLDDQWKGRLRAARRPFPAPPALAREVDAATESASRFVALRGLAFANAAFARLGALPAKEADAERPKAVDYLRAAVRYTVAEENAGRRCRAELDRQLELLERKEAEKKEPPN